MKLTNTSATELNYIRALVFGDSGVGKTTSLLTLPEKGTLLAIGERGAMPLRNKNYKVANIESWEDLQNLFGALRDPEHVENKTLADYVKDVHVFALDSLSEASELCAKQIVEIDRKELIKERTHGKREAPKDIYADQLTMEDYGLYRKKMLAIINAFCHLPIHIVMTCRAAWSQDKMGRDALRRPNLAGKASVECAAYFDLVFYMAPRGGQKRSVWQTFNDGSVIAKDASSVLEPFEETDWKLIRDKILGKGKINGQSS